MNSTSSRPRGVGGCVPAKGERRTGAWPVAEPVQLAEPQQAAEHERRYDRSEEARFVVVLGSVRAAAEEQPSPRAARAVCRRYAAAIVQLGDQVAREKQEAQP